MRGTAVHLSENLPAFNWSRLCGAVESLAQHSIRWNDKESLKISGLRSSWGQKKGRRNTRSNVRTAHIYLRRHLSRCREARYP